MQYLYKLDYNDEGHTAIETATADVHHQSSSAQFPNDLLSSSTAVTGEATLEGENTVAAESLEHVETKDDVHGKSSSAQFLNDLLSSSTAVTGEATREGEDSVAAEALEHVERRFFEVMLDGKEVL